MCDPLRLEHLVVGRWLAHARGMDSRVRCPVMPGRAQGGLGKASRASIIAESAQRRQYVFPLTRFAAWYRVSADFANLSKFSSCS